LRGEHSLSWFRNVVVTKEV